MQKCVRVMPDAFEMGAAGYSKLTERQTSAKRTCPS
jgi:ferredoxin